MIPAPYLVALWIVGIVAGSVIGTAIGQTIYEGYLK